ncbi:MAG: TrbI/VirB10 family protein [Acidobacteriota bacterium]
MDPTYGPAPAVVTRPGPKGVLPRRVGMWLMLGIAGAMVLVILFTSAPVARKPPPTATPSMMAPNPDQLRRYEERLAAADRMPVPQQADRPTLTQTGLQPAGVAQSGEFGGGSAPKPPDPMLEERRRKNYESLFASNVVQSKMLPLGDTARPSTETRRRGSDSDEAPTKMPTLEEVTNSVVKAVSAAPPPPPPALQAAAPPILTSIAARGAQGQAPVARAMDPPPGQHMVYEGTIIDTVLTNRLDGSGASPVNVLVSTPIYTASRTPPRVLIPAGARILGSTKPVSTLGETRLAVAFVRLMMPNGQSYRLDNFLGLNQIGDAGLKDQANQHYLSTFGAAAAIGLIQGLSQYMAAGFGGERSGSVVITGTTGDSTSQATSQTFARFLNRLPTVTIREGHRIKVYVMSDIALPLYQPGLPN